MASTSTNGFYSIIHLLENNCIPLDNLIARIFAEDTPSSRHLVEGFTTNICRFLDRLLHDERTSEAVGQWMDNRFKQKLSAQILVLSKRKSGYHFPTNSATPERVSDCSIQQLGKGMQKLAPDVWGLFEALLQADPVLVSRRKNAGEPRGNRTQAGGTHYSDDDEENEPELSNLLGDDEDAPEDFEEQVEDYRKSLLQIKQITCMSIMMHSTNRKCNMLQTLVGVFLQACGVPDGARNLLNHLGVSVSITAINRMVKTLSQEAHTKMRSIGATFQTAYAYDNLDIDLKHSTPVQEHTKDTLTHLTTASMFPLYHGIKAEDLNYSQFLWNLAKNPPRSVTTAELISHLPPNQEDARGFLQRDRFNAWKFRHDLVHYGPSYFAQFRGQLGEPEEMECIPVTQTQQIPMRALEISPSTPSNNAQVLEALFHQSRIGDPNLNQNNPSARAPPVADIGNHVVLVFGDLLTGQHIRSMQTSRLVDVTPWRRFQYVVYCPGWFHLRMACADALWKRFINAPGAKKDPTSLIAHIAQMRPLERPKIESGPGFRQMHESVQHVGIVLRLDAWRVELEHQDSQVSSLEDFANKKPTWDDICKISEILCKKYVAPLDMETIQDELDEERDKQHEVVISCHRDFLLYEEINHALNHGDVGRVEACMIPWMYIFMGCGKVKYAVELRRYLENVHVHYPKPLARAIRMNVLCNPSGTKGKFRAIDWVIELNNLYIKRIYGGQNSNHTVARIIEESPLIEIYRDVRIQFEEMFCFSHKTIKHAPAKMALTFAKLGRYMEQHKPNEFIMGRKGEYDIPNTMIIGAEKLTATFDNARTKADVKKETRKDRENFGNTTTQVDREETREKRGEDSEENTQTIEEELFEIEVLDDGSLGVE